MKGHYGANWLIHESEMPIEVVQQYADMLTIPNPKIGLKGEPDTLCFLFKSEDYYVFPRNMFSRRDFTTYSYHINQAKPLSEHTNEIKLRGYQKAIDQGIKQSKVHDFVLNAPCGHGKTVMGVNLISYFNQKTLILLPTRFLMRQWYNSISSMLKGLKVVTVNPAKYKFNPEDDVVIMSLDLMSGREFEEEFYANFGTVVMDEAHRMGARSYYPIISRVACKTRIALTATMRRKDGADKILMYDFGKLFSIDNQFPPAKVYGLNTYVKIPMKDVSIYRGRKLMPQYAKFDSYIASNEERNNLLFDQLMKLHKAGRRVIFIGKRKEALIAMYERMKVVVPDCLLVISETNKDDTMDKVYKGASFIFGISQLAEEGLDCPSADTLVLHNPIGDCEQAVGRILRDVPGKKEPIVLYPVDDFFFSRNIFNSYKNNYLFNNATFAGYINDVNKVI
jgi:superfamily II DNA or RNA helicase